MKIVFVGNCQAYSLSYIYDRHIGSKLGHVTAFVDGWDEGGAERNNRLIAEADIVARQVFSMPMRARLDPSRSSGRQICFPDVRGSFLWPFGNDPRPDNPTTSYKPAGPYDPEVGDRFLNRMIRENVSPAEALRRYRALDIVRETGLARIYELVMEQQRRRDARAGMEIGGFIEDHLRHERLFRTQGHLDTPLFNHLAGQVYNALGVGRAESERALANEPTYPFEPFHDAPIHPKVIAHFGIDYLDETSVYYHVQEGKFTFDEYILRYMRNEWCPELHEACALLEHPDHEHTLAMFDVALGKTIGCGHGYEKKAHLLQRLGRFSEAVEAMEQAVKYEPDHSRYGAMLHHLRNCAGRG